MFATGNKFTWTSKFDEVWVVFCVFNATEWTMGSIEQTLCLTFYLKIKYTQQIWGCNNAEKLRTLWRSKSWSKMRSIYLRYRVSQLGRLPFGTLHQEWQLLAKDLAKMRFPIRTLSPLSVIMRHPSIHLSHRTSETRFLSFVIITHACRCHRHRSRRRRPLSTLPAAWRDPAWFGAAWVKYHNRRVVIFSASRWCYLP